MDTPDILSDVLRSLRASGTVYFCNQLEPPWIKEYSGERWASFHHVRRGSAWLVSDEHRELLGTGDFVFLASGIAHSLSSEAPPNTVNSSQEAPTLLLCGKCRFDESAHSPMTSLFPRFAIVRAETLQAHPSLTAILTHLSAEYMGMRPGAHIVIDKLTEVLMVELVRMDFGSNEQAPLLRALADSQIAAALGQLHADPSGTFTLEALAKDVGLSRAGFAKRFKSLVGFSMFDYLTRLRVQRAKELLSDENVSLYAVANAVGYESDLAFTRTFRKYEGVTPTAWRKANRQTSPHTPPG